MEKQRKKVSFALCPKCLWLATYLRNNQRNCPRCDGKLSMHTVIVKLGIEEPLQKGVLLKYEV